MGFGSDIRRPLRVFARRGPGCRRSATDAPAVTATQAPARPSTDLHNLANRLVAPWLTLCFVQAEHEP